MDYVVICHMRDQHGEYIGKSQISYDSERSAMSMHCFNIAQRDTSKCVTLAVENGKVVKVMALFERKARR